MLKHPGHVLVSFGGDKWEWIANTAANRMYMPVEEWISEKRTYTVFRRVYTRDEAAEWIQKESESYMQLMEGPDMFIVSDSNDNCLLMVWKPAYI